MFEVSSQSRAGRMLQAGRLTVTFRSPSGQHVTIQAKCRRPRQGSSGWEGCALSEAKVVFFQVPNSQGGYADRVAKYTERDGFSPDTNADPARTWCAKQLLRYVNDQMLPEGLEAFEENSCGRCGRALTDPVSIERGIGPECYGQMTGSQHETKMRTGINEQLTLFPV